MSVISDLKRIFRKDQTDMMKDEGVKKGVFAGAKYAFYLSFKLPIRIIAEIVNPTWTQFRFIERFTIPIIQLVGGGEVQRINDTYSRIASHINDGIEAEMKPDIAGIEGVVNVFKARRILSLVIAAFLVSFGIEMVMEFASVVSDSAFFASVGAAFWGNQGNYSGFHGASDSFWGFLGVGISAWYIIPIVASLYFAYLVMLILRFFIDGVRAVVYTPTRDLRLFILDVLDYTIAKTEEIYGDDIAKEAAKATIEAYTLNVDGIYDHLARIGDEKRLIEYASEEEEWIGLDDETEEEEEYDGRSEEKNAGSVS